MSIEIEIDGNLVSAEAGEMLIAVTDRAGIAVPRFCYHKKLSVAANCRMCLLDVEGAAKPQPACATPVAEGMKVQTKSPRAKDAQKAVMEFLLINHPLDCPICDQGGECELQDVAMEYGGSVSRFSEGKRIIVDKNIGALIDTDMTRCIHCTRCIRFGEEIAGMMEMGATGRGEHLKIEPFLKLGIESELSGNMIDVCPVGALTSKPFHYQLRSWQMNNIPSVARHDLLGSNIYAQTYKGKVKRVVARENDEINETWISDRDRFSYEGLSHKQRLLKPQIKVEGQWQMVEWSVALNFATKGLKQLIKHHQSGKLGTLTANTATLETFYLLQKLTRTLGSENIDHRLQMKNLNPPIVLNSNIKLTDLENIEHALIISCHPRLEQPMINHRLRKASRKGATVDVINLLKFDFNLSLRMEMISPPYEILQLLAAVLKSILSSNKETIPDYLKDIKISADASKMANKLRNSKRSVIILGEHIVGDDNAAMISALVQQISAKTLSSTLNLTANNNALAADFAHCLPGKNGLNSVEMLEADLKAYLLLDIYPQYDFFDAQKALQALSKEGLFIICLNSFYDPNIAQYADVLLPISTCFEESGTSINIEGKHQSFTAAVKPPEDAKPAWKVLKVIADLLELRGFDYTSTAQIATEINNKSHQFSDIKKPFDLTLNTNKNSDNISIIWQKSPYAIDALTRAAASLQQTQIGKLNTAWMTQATANILKLTAADNYLGVPITITDEVAANCVFVYSGAEKQIEGQNQ